MIPKRYRHKLWIYFLMKAQAECVREIEQKCWEALHNFEIVSNYHFFYEFFVYFFRSKLRKMKRYKK